MKLAAVSSRLVLIGLLPAIAQAQDTRSMLFGRVVDQQSAVVAGATVEVKHTETNTTRSLTSNEAGYYQANLLIPGTYEVAVDAPGFKRLTRSGIHLPVSSQIQIDLTLEVGMVSESISVTAPAPLLETGSASGGLVLENRSLMDLPTFSNRTMDMSRFVPGMQHGGDLRFANMTQTSAALYGALPGGVGGNDYSVDGIPNLGDGRRAGEHPFTDVLQEFKIDTSGFDASVGNTTGATIAMMTKAGTNQLHGTATWQHWQQPWNGSTLFARQAYYRSIAQAEVAGDTALANQIRSRNIQPSAHSNNYGATIGGPVVLPRLFDGRNKLFFFFSVNGFKDNKTAQGDVVNRTIPTMRAREGDFSDLLAADAVRYVIHDPLTVRPDPARPSNFIRTPLPGNIVPRSRIINPAYQQYVKFLPVPNSDPSQPGREPLNNYRAYGMPNFFRHIALTNRTDYYVTSNLRLFGRWGWARPAENRNDWTFASAPGLHDDRLSRLNRNASVDAVYTLSSSTILNVTSGTNEFREYFPIREPRDFKPSTVGLPAYLDERAGSEAILPRMAFDGYTAIGQTLNNGFKVRIWSTKADITHIRGSHSFRAGFDTRRRFRTGGGGGDTSGNFSFTNAFTRRNDDSLTPAGSLGHSWAAFMMGLPSSMSLDISDTFAFSSPYYGWFVQDTWRVTPKLSLTLGLRMEHEVGTIERYDRSIGTFDPNAALPIAEGAKAAYARNPLPELPPSAFEVRGGSTYAGDNGERRLFDNEFMLLPRIGVAYQLTPRTVLRGGYGIFFDSVSPLIYRENQFGYSRATTTPVTSDFGQTWLAGDPRNGVSPLVNPFPVRADGTRFDQPVRNQLGAMARAGRGFSYNSFDWRRARQQRFRVGVQRQFSQTLVIEAAYAGIRADRFALSRTISALPEQYWADGLVRNNAVVTDLNRNLPNPFRITNFTAMRTSHPLIYQDMSGQTFFNNANIRKEQLLRPFPHIGNLVDTTSPEGELTSHSFEVQLQKRFSGGFNLNAGYTGLRLREADYFHNEFDAMPSWRESNDGRPHRFTIMGVYEFPFGPGRMWASHGLLSHVLGGWQAGSTYEFQNGPLLNFGNLFYYGDIDNIRLSRDEKTLDRWFNTSDFERVANRTPAAFHKRVFPTRVGGVRADGINMLNVNLARSFSILERFKLQFRVDAMNVVNRSTLAGPNTSPTSTDFGRVVADTPNIGRFFQFQARLTF